MRPAKDDDASVRNLEKKLRKVVDKDPSHYQAMISLAKRLVLKEAFEEAEDYITKAQAEAKTGAIEKSATKLEMLGSLYQRGCVSKLSTNHLEKAIDKFQGALSVDPNSEKARHGFSRCLLRKFLNTKSKKAYFEGS